MSEYLFQYANRADIKAIRRVVGRGSGREWAARIQRPRARGVVICAWRRGLEGVISASVHGDHLHLETVGTREENPELACKLLDKLSRKVPVIALVPEESLESQVELRDLGFQAVLPLLDGPGGKVIEFWRGV